MGEAKTPDLAPRGDEVASLIRAGAELDPIEARLAMQRIRSRLKAPTTPDPIIIGRHHVLRRIGEGGFGAVYEAFDPQLERKLAVKVLRVGLDDPDATERALREAKLAAAVSHPNVVAVFDVGLLDRVEELGSGVYLAMELVDGDTLAAWMLEHRSAPWREVVPIFVQAGRGLAAAHASGVVHRDFKPANVLLGPADRVRVVDFGLASLAGRGSEGGDGPSGTPAYMAPEQHRGETSDARTDIYAFCVALYEALCGALPFAPSETDSLLKTKERLGLRWPNRIPAHLQAAVERGLSPDPAQRFEAMPALLEALERDPQATRRRWALAGIGLVAAVGLGYVLAARAPTEDATTACATPSDPALDYDATAIGAAFERTEIGYAADAWARADAQLREQLASLEAARVRVCEDREVLGRSAPQLLARRERCVQRREAELRSLIELFEQADAETVAHAVEATYALEDPSVCNVSVVPPSEPAAFDEHERELADDVEDLIARLSALELLGAYASAEPLIDELIDRAELLPRSSSRAEAYLVAARMRKAAGDETQAEELGQRAALEAEASADDLLTARAKTFLAGLVGYDMSRIDEGLLWARNAEAALRRAGDTPAVEAEFHRVVGSLYHRKGDFERSREHLEQALDIRIELHGERHPRVATARGNLATVAWRLGDLDSAERAHREALETRVEAFGPDHPVVATTIAHLGLLSLGRDDYESAREKLERALALQQAALPAVHPDLARSHQFLGMAYAGPRPDGSGPRALHDRGGSTAQDPPRRPPRPRDRAE